MKFWWVNQNKTHDQEIVGGYMWSPKTKRNGARNPYYDSMTKVKPGDIVFSFFDTRIPFLGVIKSHGYSQPMPSELHAVDNAWDEEGWMVNVDYRPVRNNIRPKDYIDEIRPFLPDIYSPLQQNGKGIQGIYLTHINEGLAKKLLEIIGQDAQPAIFEGKEHEGELKNDLEAEEERIEKLIKKDAKIDTTEKETIVRARKGQGKFRNDVISLHKRCPFTGIENPKFLKAGHLKPWSKCDSNSERIDPLNGLALTPNADLLVDQGLITFNEEGSALFSPDLIFDDLKSMGIDPGGEYKIPIINEDHRAYVIYHKTKVAKF